MSFAARTASGSTSSRSPRASGTSPRCARAVDGWLAAGDDVGAWIDWEQRKHERLLVA